MAIDRLSGLVPEMQPIVTELLARMKQAGLPMMVTDGYRSMTDQRKLWRMGRFDPGAPCTHGKEVRKVGTCSTHPLGVPVTWTQKRSWHLVGRAVDCAFLDAASKPTWPDISDPRWLTYGETAQSLGLTWGYAEWERDAPHVHLKAPGKTLDKLVDECRKG